jgi:hypothetical protein
VVAAGPDGSAAVAWLESRDAGIRRPERRTLRVARRAAGGAFGAPETLVARHDGDWNAVAPAVAVDAAGATTVAWARARSPRGQRSAIEVATAAPGAAFGAPQRIAGRPYDVAGVALAAGSGGRALLAHDGDETVRVYERAPGAAAFAPAPVFTSGAGARRPELALAADGGAVVAWRSPGLIVLPPAGDAVAAQDADGVKAATRPPGGPFGPERDLQPPADEDGPISAGAYVTGGRPVDVQRDRVRAAAAPGGLAAVAWLAPSPRFGAPAAGRIAVATPAGFAPATPIGGPVRDVDAVLPWLGAAGPAAVWADNRATAVLLPIPEGLGRLHLSQATRPAARPPAPAVELAARPQALYFRDPLIVDATCAAACDLRATVAPRARPRSGALPGAALGAGGRTTPGRVRLRLAPAAGHLAPRGGGSLRVVVRAAAPGGAAVSRSSIRVRVRRRTPPPFQRPFDVRARRAGDDVLLRWRTPGPARRMSFIAFGRRTRGKRFPARELAPLAWRNGRGDRRFRLRLRGARRARWVVLLASSDDPPTRSARIVVPVRGRR